VHLCTNKNPTDFFWYNKIMKKQFQTCYSCEHKSLCKVAKSRLEGLDINSPTIRDIGCFDYEIYKRQIEDKQLTLGF